MCEKNPNLSVCDSLIESPKYLTFDQYSKWDICRFRSDLSFCQRFPAKLLITEFKNEVIIPLKRYESSRESNGFVEPITTTEITTKVTKIFTSTKLSTIPISTTTTTTIAEVEGSGENEDEENKSTEESTEKLIALFSTAVPLLVKDP